MSRARSSMSVAGADAQTEFVIRPATAADADAIAMLHADSWLTAYRGILSDEYLDDAMRAERQRIWRERLARPKPGQIVLVAPGNGKLAGFVCLFTRYGALSHSYIDNLHVAPRLHGKGLGRMLMVAVAHAIPETEASLPVSLTVFEANRGACAFYDAVGGVVGERLMEIEADGRRLPTLRYVWDNAQALIEGATLPWKRPAG